MTSASVTEQYHIRNDLYLAQKENKEVSVIRESTTIVGPYAILHLLCVAFIASSALLVVVSG